VVGGGRLDTAGMKTRGVWCSCVREKKRVCERGFTAYDSRSISIKD
jgi:hypothetical protein